MPSCFDVDREGYPIDKPQKIKKAKVCRALEFPPLQQEEQQSTQQKTIPPQGGGIKTLKERRGEGCDAFLRYPHFTIERRGGGA